MGKWKSLIIITGLMFTLNLFLVSAAWTSSLNDHLIAYWNFDANADDKTNSHDGVVSGATLLTNCKLGGCYRFDGTNDNITASNNNNDFNFGTNEFTINFWMNNTNDGGRVIQRHNSVDSGWFFYHDSSINKLFYRQDADEIKIPAKDSPKTNDWSMITVVKNSTNTTIWINNTIQNITANLGIADVSLPVVFGQDFGAATFWAGDLDEVGIWNRSLIPSEITALYNSGSGITYREPFVSLNSPADNYNVLIDSVLSFNCTAESTYNIANITLFIDGVRNYTKTDGASNKSELYYSLNTLSFGTIGTHTWSCLSYNTQMQSDWPLTNRTFNVSTVQENSQTYNATTTETKSESFNINVTYNSTHFTAIAGTLYFNNVAYLGTSSGTGNTKSFTRAIQVPVGSGSKNQYWMFGLTNSTGTSYYNSSSNSITINQLVLGLCNSTLSTPFINFTFKDEETTTNMTAKVDSSTWNYWIGDGTVNKSYSYSNTAVKSSWAFCAIPNETISTSLTFKYANESYPQRTYAFSGSLTNVTTNQVLYLLSSTDGIYSSIQVIEATQGTAIEGVLLVIEREIGGLWTIVGQSLTGADGLATFWVNPNYPHRITATKTGYAGGQVIITPSQSVYTLSLTRSSGDILYASDLEGLKWKTSPPSGYLTAGTYNFQFNLTASLNNLDGSYCKLELVEVSNGTVMASSTGGYSSGCNLSISYTLSTGEWIYGKLYIDTTNTSGFALIDADQRWGDIEGTDISTWQTVFTFFDELKNLDEWGRCDIEGTCHRAEFSRIVFFFLMLTMLIGIFSYLTQFDTVNPGMAIVLVSIIILFASFAGWFTLNLGNSQFDTIEKYTIFLISFMLTAGTLLNYFART